MPAQIGPKSASFIHHARRSQLVEAAIAEISELGLQRASTVRIAERAGISRGVLTYHFDGREDLLDAVVAEVYRVAGGQLRGRVAGAGGPRDSLLAFVAGSIEFYAAYPDHMAALSEVFAAPRAGRERTHEHRGEMTDVAMLLREGKRQGSFREFDVDTMTDAIRAVLDVGLRRIRRGADVPALRDELTALIDAATRKRP